jgi:hypothetical protein
MRWEGHVACVIKRLLLDLRGGGNLKKSDHLHDIDVDGRAILNLSCLVYQVSLNFINYCNFPILKELKIYVNY